MCPLRRLEARRKPDTREVCSCAAGSSQLPGAAPGPREHPVCPPTAEGRSPVNGHRRVLLPPAISGWDGCGDQATFAGFPPAEGACSGRLRWTRGWGPSQAHCLVCSDVTFGMGVHSQSAGVGRAGPLDRPLRVPPGAELPRARTVLREGRVTPELVGGAAVASASVTRRPLWTRGLGVVRTGRLGRSGPAEPAGCKAFLHRAAAFPRGPLGASPPSGALQGPAALTGGSQPRRSLHLQ